MPAPLVIPTDSRAGEEGSIRAVDHAVIGGVVAVVVFAMLCLLIILGRYFARHKGKHGAGAGRQAASGCHDPHVCTGWAFSKDVLDRQSVPAACGHLVYLISELRSGETAAILAAQAALC